MGYLAVVKSYCNQIKSSTNHIKLHQVKANVGYWPEEKTIVPGEKTLRAVLRIHKLNPNMTSRAEIEPVTPW